MNRNKFAYISRQLAFAEGMYKGVFSVLPSDLRVDKIDVKTVSFMFNEKAINNTLETVNNQIRLYKNAINDGNLESNIKKYGQILDCLELVRIKLLNVVAKMNEPEDSDEDDYGM